jgi:hypothetical protein
MSTTNKVIKNNAINEHTGNFKFLKSENRLATANDTYTNKYTKVVNDVLTMFVEVFIIQWTNLTMLKRVLKSKIAFVEEYQNYINEEKIEIGRLQNYLNSINETDIPVLTDNNIDKNNINIASSEYSDELIWNVLKYTVNNKSSIIKEVTYAYLEAQNLGTFNRDTHRTSKIPSKKELVND